MELLLYQTLDFSQVSGPGNRFCLWVQGCRHCCEGCMLPQTWSFHGGERIRVDDLYKQIMKVANIEGVTFLGGEPFEQAEALALLGEMLQEQGLSIVTFTGFTKDFLQKSNKASYQALLEVTDLLIDGRFEIAKKNFERPWIGSANQQYHFLTNRYSFKDIEKAKNKIDVRVTKNGNILFNGMGDFEEMKKLFISKKMEM